MQRKSELYSFQLLLRATAKGCEDNREDNLISKTTTTFSNLNSMRNYNFFFFFMFFWGVFYVFYVFYEKNNDEKLGEQTAGNPIPKPKTGGLH